MGNENPATSVPSHGFRTIQSRSNTPDQGVARWEWRALYKSHNAESAYWGGFLWASQEGAIRGVMPLGKDWAIPGEACLAASPFLNR